MHLLSCVCIVPTTFRCTATRSASIQTAAGVGIRQEESKATKVGRTWRNQGETSAISQPLTQLPQTFETTTNLCSPCAGPVLFARSYSVIAKWIRRRARSDVETQCLTQYGTRSTTPSYRGCAAERNRYKPEPSTRPAMLWIKWPVPQSSRSNLHAAHVEMSPGSGSPGNLRS